MRAGKLAGQAYVARSYDDVESVITFLINYSQVFVLFFYYRETIKMHLVYGEIIESVAFLPSAQFHNLPS